MNPLTEACREVMRDSSLRSKYPEGPTSVQILDEIRLKHGADAFPLCTWIDVHDEMTKLSHAVGW